MLGLELAGVVVGTGADVNPGVQLGDKAPDSRPAPAPGAPLRPAFGQRPPGRGGGGSEPAAHLDR